jgi:hypothetical protein
VWADRDEPSASLPVAERGRQAPVATDWSVAIHPSQPCPVSLLDDEPSDLLVEAGVHNLVGVNAEASPSGPSVIGPAANRAGNQLDVLEACLDPELGDDTPACTVAMGLCRRASRERRFRPFDIPPRRHPRMITSIRQHGLVSPSAHSACSTPREQHARPRAIRSQFVRLSANSPRPARRSNDGQAILDPLSAA